jgi:hypothetical protein
LHEWGHDISLRENLRCNLVKEISDMTARIGNLVWKELLQLARDWLLTTFLFVLPMLQLVLLARATGRGVKEQPVVILDLDRSAVTRELAVRLDNREELAVTRFVEDERGAGGGTGAGGRPGRG